jgi:hypothetical protein
MAMDSTDRVRKWRAKRAGEGRTRFEVAIQERLLEQVRRYAAARELTMPEAVERALRELLAKERSGKP